MKNVDVDVVVVGAGFSGLYLLYRLRKAGFSTRVFERGGDVGGTWYWNRYPGARCDVESLQYSYSFDEQLQQDWHWPEKFSAQPDILAYANHVADRFNLKKDIEFNIEVKASWFDENLKRWKITTNTGEEINAQYFIMATGCISTTQIPNIKGLSDLVGNTFHTGDWPHEEVDFSGQSIAVIGTGSSGIQSIPVLAKQAKKLTVFQRTPNYSIPSQNEPMTKKYERSWKDVYSERRKEMRYSAHGSLKDLNDVPALSVDEDQRQELYTKRWAIGGTGFLGSFNDLLTNADANYTAAEYVRQQIKRVVKDKETAEILCPRSYPIGTKRICIDTGYFETYNRENVKLVDISKKPIQRLVADGIIVDEQLYAFDSIIFATGFDAMTGSIFNVDIKKVNQDQRRKAKAINFGIIYGISQYGLAKQINVTNHEAEEFLNAYFLKFPEIKIYMDRTIKFCRKSGFVNNIFGRRSHFININDKNYNIRNFQERAAINAPIQGSAAEIMRLAMIRLDKKLSDQKNQNTKMLLQIHDELIFETPKEEAKRISKIIIDEMSSVVKSEQHSFSIPLTVDLNTGENWGTLH